MRRAALRHVRWSGGPPDASKSTVAELLAARHGLPVYRFDRHEPDHIARADPVRHPALHAPQTSLAELDQPAWLDEHWLRRPVAELARDAIGCWTERVDLAVEDLLAMPANRPIIAGGPGFFPEAILPLLATPRHAIWLLPTDAFKRASHERRGKTGLRHAMSAPDRAYRQHVARDLLMAEHYRRSTRALGLPVIAVDGSRSAEETAAAVAAHVSPLLAEDAPAHPTA